MGEHIGRVFGENLLEDQVIVAISAVTEALQREYGVYDEEDIPKRNVYSLMSITNLANAKFRPVPADFLKKPELLVLGEL